MWLLFEFYLSTDIDNIILLLAEVQRILWEDTKRICGGIKVKTNGTTYAMQNIDRYLQKRSQVTAHLM